VPHPAIVTFTARPCSRIIHDGGSRDWRLDPLRARRAEFLVCTQNRRNAAFVDPAFGPPDAPHGAAFLIGRISGVVPSPENPDRWLIRISEYSVPVSPIPNIWAKSGHLRYPVWYTSLEELGIGLAALPPFQPMPVGSRPAGLSEATGRPVLPPRDSRMPAPRLPDAAGPEAWTRLEAILAQLDRVPDLANPQNPLAWDEHGVPR
jgi:hypothetical protein